MCCNNFDISANVTWVFNPAIFSSLGADRAHADTGSTQGGSFSTLAQWRKSVLREFGVLERIELSYVTSYKYYEIILILKYKLNASHYVNYQASL